jgi:2-keto-4-pentenoate hydratase/2-oxohepta-3-ene-1,7-dioic acid hydratase in catechol pathway
MRIIRFLDQDNQTCYGHQYRDREAVLLKGELFTGLEDTGRRVPVKKLLAPFVPNSILGIGLNYSDHAKETNLEIPKYPVLFMKSPASLTHPEDPIVIPESCKATPEVDYEAELGVVIGKTAKNVPEESALDYVFGYTAGNDVSARRWQKHAGGGQWVRGKSFDTFCPIGPELVTADEIPDPQKIGIRCILNGETMQDGNTANMIFPVRTLIAYLSKDSTLLPGTLILTGTPSGVGFTRKPPRFLQHGDVVEIHLEGIAALKNPVVAE